MAGGPDHSVCEPAHPVSLIFTLAIGLKECPEIIVGVLGKVIVSKAGCCLVWLLALTILVICFEKLACHHFFEVVQDPRLTQWLPDDDGRQRRVANVAGARLFE